MAQILVTIDTEVGELGKDAPDAFEVFIEGKVHNREVGYGFIMDVLDEYGAKGEFFIDIYPYREIGENNFASLCENIVKRGHCVQLHTHPSTLFDKERIFLHQYSLEEQREILLFGKEKLREWIGTYPLAHRAGGYGINEYTFKALEEAGVGYDSSYFYGNKNCKFHSNIKNKPFRIKSVTEIPITVFKRVLRDKLFLINICRREQFNKLDMRYGVTIEEIKEVINKTPGDDIIVLFLHSFNFLDLLYDFRGRKLRRIGIDEEGIKGFENLIIWISSQENCSFITMDRLKVDFSGNDTCVEIVGKGSVVKRICDNFRNKVFRVEKI